MSTVTVAATVEADNTPPRVRLNVTDTGTPAITSTTVTRLDPDGRTVPVRTFDGNPLTLTTSGSNRVGLLYDYEAPLGAQVTYSTQETPTSGVTVTVPGDSVWLIHPGVPALSMPVQLRVGSFADETLPVRQGVHSPMGRENPVVITDGARGGSQSSLIVAVESAPQVRAIRDLVRDAGVLMLNIPESFGFLIDPCYIAVGDVRINRPSDIGSNPLRDVTMPYFVVDRPVGGSQAQRTLLDLLDYPTLDSLSAYPTLNDLLAGP